MHLGGIRLAVTSPVPLLIWCVAIAVVRHLVSPQQPLYREFPHQLALWARVPAVRFATAVTIGTRPVMLVVGYLAVYFFGFRNRRAPLRHFTNEDLNLPVAGRWYLRL